MSPTRCPVPTASRSLRPKYVPLSRPPAILPHAAQPPPTPYQPPDKICRTCKIDASPVQSAVVGPVARKTSSARGHGRVSLADVPASSSPESSLSPHSPQSPHDHIPVCAPAPDSHDSASQGHEPPTPTPLPSPVFFTPPYPSQLSFATSQPHFTEPASVYGQFFPLLSLSAFWESLLPSLG
ncbi:hypothetical protein BU17DRAFT_103679 [Hysterangium stoloniferum]|nr:hypothetical protein BU17DRAFT_103679 [Hysterangium stoloniferum]